MRYKLKCNMRTRMYNSLKGKTKSFTTIKLLGCNGLQFKEYLQKGFTKKMTWENYGSYWHIDHIRPLASFDISIPEEQQKAFHFSNCQPLEAKANLTKSDSWNGEMKLFFTND